MVAFPVALGARPSFSDDYGAARSGGRSHEGSDIFAPEGTAVFAVDDGDVRATTDTLGGNVVYLAARDGARYYYAHLRDHAGPFPRTVKAGDTIGTVGTTGNAAGLPPHLHFEIHPTGTRETVNPFPELQRLRGQSSAPSKMSDGTAWAVVTAAMPELTPAESQFLRTVARFETSYGRGWKDNGDQEGDPRESHNWGAITANSPPWFVYRDTRADGTPYEAHFKAYPNDVEGVRALAHELFTRRPAVRAAVARGDGALAVQRMKESGYFVAPLASYQGAAKRNFDAMILGTGEPRALAFNVSPGSVIAAPLGTGGVDPLGGLVVAGLALGLLWWFGKGFK